MSRTPSTFTVRVTLLDGGLWRAAVEGLPEVHPADRSLSKLEGRIRREIAAQAESGTAPHLDITFSTGDEGLDAEIHHARALRDKAQRIAEEARNAAAPAARQLKRRGVSMRDAGTLLGYSGSSISTMTT